MNIMKFRRWLVRVLLLGMTSWSFTCALPSSAVTITNVNVADNFFSPASVTIAVNDKVKWTWTGFNTHSSTSDTALWDSGSHGIGFRFTNTFTTAGSFPYHCTTVGHESQIGTVTVLGPNGPPILLSNAQRPSQTQFQFDYTAGSGLHYVIERSAGFSNFVPLATNIASGSSVTFTDSTATLDQNYCYRVRFLPSP